MEMWRGARWSVVHKVISERPKHLPARVSTGHRRFSISFDSRLFQADRVQFVLVANVMVTLFVA